MKPPPKISKQHQSCWNVKNTYVPKERWSSWKQMPEKRFLPQKLRLALGFLLTEGWTPEPCANAWAMGISQVGWTAVWVPEFLQRRGLEIKPGWKKSLGLHNKLANSYLDAKFQLIKWARCFYPHFHKIKKNNSKSNNIIFIISRGWHWHCW